MITLDDGKTTKKLSDFGFRELSTHDNPSQPPFDRRTVSIPGREGAWEFEPQIGEKPANIPVKHLAMSETEFQLKLDEFNQFFYDEFGKPKELKLIYDYEKDKYIYVKLAQNFSPDRQTILKSIDIPFISSKPRKEARFLPSEITWGSKVIDFTFPYRFGLGRNGEGGVADEQVTTPRMISVTAEGLVVKPILILEGSGTNVSISNNDSIINVGTFTNTKWEIDCINYISYKNGVETFLNMNEFWLMPSVNQLKIAGTGLNFKFSVKFRNRYL